MQSKNNVTVKSLDEYIKELILKIQKLGHNNIIWFRGEGTDNYKLVPNIYRRTYNKEMPYWHDIAKPKDFLIIEQKIDTSFYRKASMFLAAKGIKNTLWNRYFLKQHYGVKTRLLDWTENALFALFFSLHARVNIKTNARVWILSPFTLNNYSIGKLHNEEKTFYKILTLSDFEQKQDLINQNGEFRIKELGRRYYQMECNGKDLYPLAIYPPHLDSRMAAQQSCFTLFGNKVMGLNDNDCKENFLEKIDIDVNYKQQILDELKLIGISYYSIFPDLDGLGKSINEDSAFDIQQGQNNNDLDTFFNQVEQE